VLADELGYLAGYRDIAKAIAARDGNQAARAARRTLAKGTTSLFKLLDGLEKSGGKK